MRNYLLIVFPLTLFLGAGCKGANLANPDDLGGDVSADLSVSAADYGPGPDIARAPTCSDGVKNGSETDVDCGGVKCPGCNIGQACIVPGDCISGMCAGKMCVGSGCTDGIKNGDETGIDCGGSCPNACLPGQGCMKNSDCTSHLCMTSLCAPPGCADGIKNGSETDVDCGGGACEQCTAGKRCAADSDCFTKLCDPQLNVCIGCGDLKQNGTETDVDCGGKLCAPCSIGKKCVAHTDCTSNLCNGNNRCQACAQDNDCQFKICKNGVCSLAPIVGVLNNTTFFQVQVKGAMTDTNVFAACKAAGLNTPCQSSLQGCMYNDNMCSPSPESQCGNPMQDLAKKLCNGQGPASCNALFGCYQYMGHHWVNDSSCGAEQGVWCATGANMKDRFALCIN